MGVWYIYYVLAIASALGASFLVDHQEWGFVLLFTLFSVLMSMSGVAEKICKAIKERSQ